MFEYAVLCFVAALGGAVNSVAGGGTLLTFPTLFSVLGGTAEAAVLANATSTVALLPGAISAVGGYRRELKDTAPWIPLLLVPSIVGGIIGALLLTFLPADTFKAAVPWLILTAALLFAIQPLVTRWTGVGHETAAPHRSTAVAVASFQLLVAIYGGYFGAGIGILMLSALAFMGLGDIHRMNALKSLLGGAINAVAVVVFLFAGTVVWKYALPMMVASIIGGYCGASVARKLDKHVVRYIVIAIGLSLAAYYFLRPA